MLNGFASAKDIILRTSNIWVPPKFTGMDVTEYIETNLKVATEDDPPLIVPMKFNPVQKKLEKLLEKIESPKTSGKRVMILKSRRMGVTTLLQAVSYAKMKIQPGFKCVTVAQTKDVVEEIFEMVKLFHKEDKNFIRASKNSTTELAYAALRTKFSVATAGGVAIKRGDTLHRVHGSEVAFWELNDKDSENLIASLDKAGNKGEMFLESTANGTAGIFYNLWVEAVSGKSRWKPLFLGWHLDVRNSIILTNDEVNEIIDTIDEDEIFLVKKFGCNANQLAWRREQVGHSEKSKRIFKQEYPAFAEEAFVSTGHGYFDSQMLESKIKECLEPIYKSEETTIWKRPEEGHTYIVAADTSEGNVDSDPSPIVILDWNTGEQVYMKNWCVRPQRLGKECVKLAKEYNGAIIAIENNNTGHSAINTVMNQELYQNVYFHEDDVRDESKKEHSPGWRTDRKTKPILLGDLDDAIEKGHMKVNDKVFIEQCKTFIDKNGSAKSSGTNGHHGDLVIAWGIAWQVRSSKQVITKSIFV